MNRYKSHGSGIYDRKDFHYIGNNVIIENNVLVFHPENIILNDNVYIGHGSVLKGYYKNEFYIGEGCWIGQNCFFHSAGGIRIEEKVGIGPMVKIITSFHKEEPVSSAIIDNVIVFKSVSIGAGSDIGVGSVIMPGVEIGKGVQIGAGSIVSKSIPDYSVAYGNPAVVKRKRGF